MAVERVERRPVERAGPERLAAASSAAAWLAWLCRMSAATNEASASARRSSAPPGSASFCVVWQVSEARQITLRRSPAETYEDAGAPGTPAPRTYSFSCAQHALILSRILAITARAIARLPATPEKVAARRGERWMLLIVGELDLENPAEAGSARTSSRRPVIHL
ncbi:MAG: hypothetical protein R3F11_29875 [Verrucomicrobiales bacterium]